MAAAEAACADPRNHRYTPAAGLPELREAIAAKTLRDSGLEVAASQVLVTNGGKQAVYQAFATLVDPGDEVLLPAPYWTTYPEAIALAGGVAGEVPCEPGGRASCPRSSSSRRPAPSAPRRCCGARRRTRPGRWPPAELTEASAGGPPSTTSG